MKKVTIVPGCISCGTCEAVCPNVFVVKGVAEVKQDADIQKNAELVQEAADMCPVNVIKVEE
jgi:ferredoxin